MATKLNKLLDAPTTYALGLAPRTPCAPLKGANIADIAIIGAGYAGLSAARILAEASRSVCVLEAGVLGCGASGRNGGQMIPGFNLAQYMMRDEFGPDTAQKLWQAVERKRFELIALTDATPDKCDLQDGIVYAALTEAQLEYAKSQIEDLAKHHAYPHLRLIDRDEMQQTICSSFLGGIEWSDAKHLNPYKLTLLLAEKARSAGTQLYENSRVEKLQYDNDGFRLFTGSGCVKARQVILCGGAGFFRPSGLSNKASPPTHTPIATFILATEPCDAERILPSGAAISDMRNAMSYFRRTPDNRILYGGEVGLSIIDSGMMLRALEQEMHTILPATAAIKIETAWAGLIDMTRSLLPTVCRQAPGLYQTDGFSGQGVVISALAGESIAHEILAADKNQQHEIFTLLSRLQPPKVPSIRALAMLLQGLRWLPKVIEDRWRT